MVQMFYKWDRVMKMFFLESDKGFTVREISKKTKVPSSSVQRYLKELKKEGLVDENNKARITPYFKFLKTYFIINKIYTCGLYDYLINELNPSLIILYGSVRKGEYDNESDIDLFVESSVKKDIKLISYEKKFGLSIHLMIEQDVHKLNQNLFNNLINGIKIFGIIKY